MTTPRPSLALALVGVVLAASPMGAQTDCSFQYRLQAGAINTTLLPRTEVSLSAGESKQLDANYLREALNLGGNDLAIRVFLGGSGTEHVLIDVDGSTLVLPPIPFAIPQLASVECLTFATVSGATNLLNTLGTSASQVVADATEDARQAAESARAEALQLFDTAQAAGWWEDLEPMAGGLQARWDSIMAALPDASGSGPVTLGAHFPELAAAMDATSQFSPDLEAATAAARGRLNELRSDLDALHGTYASSALNAITSIELPRDFPEIQAMLDHRCTITGGPAAVSGTLADGWHFSVDLRDAVQVLATELRTLDEKYDVAGKLGALAAIPTAFDQALAASEQEGWCDDAESQLEAAADVDRTAWADWSRRHAQALTALRGGFVRPDERARLGALEEAVAAREDDYRRARAERARARDGYRLARTVQRDPSSTAQERHQAARTVRAYNSLRTQEHRARLQYLRAHAAHGQYAQTLAAKRGTGREIQAYRDVLRRRPAPTTGRTAIEAALQCAEDSERLWGLAFDGLGAAIEAAEAAAASTIPADVKAQLGVTAAAADAYATVLVRHASEVVSVKNAQERLQARMDELAAVGGERVENDRTSAGTTAVSGSIGSPVSKIGEVLKNAVVGLREFVTGSAAYLTDWEGSAKERTDFLRETAELTSVIEGNARGLQDDVTGVVGRLAVVPAVDAAGAVVTSTGECASSMSALAAEAENTLQARAEALEAALLAAAEATVPPEVMAALEEVMASAADAAEDLAALEKAGLAGLGQIVSVVATVISFLETVGFPEVNLTPIPLVGSAPVPYPMMSDPTPSLDKLLAQAAGLESDRSAFHKAGENAVTSHGQLVQDLAALGEALSSAGRAFEQDAAELSAPGPAPDFATKQAAAMQALGIAWAAAVTSLPVRVPAAAAIVLRMEVEQKAATIQQSLQQIATAAAAYQQCLATGTDATRTLADAQLLEQVVTSSVADIENVASDVLDDLSDLLDPVSFLDDLTDVTANVPEVLAAGEDLVEALEEVGDHASQAFLSQTAATRTAAQTAGQCTLNQQLGLTEMASDVAQVLNDLVERMRQLEALGELG
jgi:hypothetical protein